MQLANFFSVKSMLKEDQIIGEIPSSSQAYKNFFKIAWPSALEAFLVGAIGSVDTIMVGKLGEGAITAVGITNQPKLILLAMITSLNVGVTAITARRKGQQDQRGANRTLRAGIVICAILSVLMSIIGFIFAKPILILAGAEDSYIKDAITYFRILMFSIPFQALNLTINAGHRGCGKTKISMTTNIISNLVNIFFDYLLINGVAFFPRMEVAGAAIATVIAQATVTLVFITEARKRPELFSGLNLFVKPDIYRIKRIVRLGFPVALQSGLFTIIAMIIARIISRRENVKVKIKLKKIEDKSA